MVTILVTGFGPFPGAAFNPTGPLVKRLAGLRRPALADAKIVAHVFATSYATVDRELPELIARYKPDALLMFGLAPRGKTLRVETRAQNSLALLPDAAGATSGLNAISTGVSSSLALPNPARKLFGALRSARVPTVISRDAGCYLCNYLCWRAAEAASAGNRLRVAAFVHVPQIRRGARRPRSNPRLSLDDLVRAGGRVLRTLVAEARR